MGEFEEKKQIIENAEDILLIENDLFVDAINHNVYQEVIYLKKKVKRIEFFSIASFVAIVLLVIVAMTSNTNNTSGTVQKSSNVLPKSIDASIIKGISSDIQERYNSQDIESIYNILDEYAQTQITIGEFEKTMNGIRVLGLIEDISYSHAESFGIQQGAEWYTLHYIARYEAGNGTLRVSLRVVDDGWQIVGFHMNVDNLKAID